MCAQPGHAVKSGTHPTIGQKAGYLEIDYPELCQPIEQENLDPNKALGQSTSITVALKVVLCVV